jgi:hypothetical protein
MSSMHLFQFNFGGIDLADVFSFSFFSFFSFYPHLVVINFECPF